MKRLVAYFSASKTTEKVANMIAEEGGYDICEITPKEAYTKADLNWMDKKSRSSVEMKDKKIRPEIKNNDIDMSQYDEIILGFPIWWYVAKRLFCLQHQEEVDLAIRLRNYSHQHQTLKSWKENF